MMSSGADLESWTDEGSRTNVETTKIAVSGVGSRWKALRIEGMRQSERGVFHGWGLPFEGQEVIKSG